MVYEADARLQLYVNGSPEGSISTAAMGSISNGLPTAIGAALAASGVEGTHSQFFGGRLDEVRLSNTARGAGWLWTSFRNMNDPASFHDVGEEESGTPTGVVLATFTAEAGVGKVLLNWETATEIDIAGFNLYRSDAPEGDYIRVNRELIVSQVPGSMQGTVYSWEDADIGFGHTYYYKLETVNIHGAVTVHGPVAATLDTRPTHSTYLPVVTK
jgi:hypothetical protein